MDGLILGATETGQKMGAYLEFKVHWLTVGYLFVRDASAMFTRTQAGWRANYLREEPFMSDTSPVLKLPFLQPSQAQKHVTHNEALRRLDLMVQLRVLATDAQTPPTIPDAGDVHALGSAPTGAWAGQAGKLAAWLDEGWQFFDPQIGWRAWDINAQQLKIWTGAAWIVPQAGLQNLDGLGIGTTSDATNRLAVQAPATLLNHEGAGHQLKLNKATAGDTASMLFQSNWTGHAEMGLAGDTGFSIKVSDDGSTWTTALSFDPATGLPQGAAVQSDATDTTVGRLMRADYGYGPGNLLGAVTQTGGTPTGAVIEHGSNANGAYTRWADGTQICRHSINLGDVTAVGSGSRAQPYLTTSSSWAYPAAFSDTPTVTGSAMPGGGGAYERMIVLAIAAANSTFAGTINATRLSDVSSSQTVTAHLLAIGRWF
jgi:Protein of unknown function (DUF2793)